MPSAELSAHLMKAAHWYLVPCQCRCSEKPQGSTQMNSVFLFISPQESATKIDCHSIDLVLPWFCFKDTPFIFIKLMSLGKSKQWVHILISYRRLSETLQHLSALKSCHADCIFGEICQRMPPPPSSHPTPPPSDFHIHVQLMNTSWLLWILCTSGGRQWWKSWEVWSYIFSVGIVKHFLQMYLSRPPPETSGKVYWSWRCVCGGAAD